jgi:hypothetical protein
MLEFFPSFFDWFAIAANDDVFRDPSRFSHLEFTNQTILHPLGFTGLCLSLLGLLALPRKQAIIPVIILLCFVPSAQRITVATVDFQFMRILGIFGLIRILARAEYKGVRWKLPDLVMVIFVALPLLTVFPRGVAGSFMNMAGQGLDFFSMYVIGRCLVYNRAAWGNFASAMFIIGIPVMVAFTIEKATSRNFFSLFGGVPEITAVREGKLRAQGAFAHPILAGVWWAAMAPIFFSMYFAHPNHSLGRIIAWIGVPMSVTLALLTASSTPVGGCVIGIGLWLIFPFRKQIIQLRWYIGLGLVALHFISSSGLHGLLLTKFTFVSGSTGWHRYRLIDAALQRIPDWFLFGTRSTYSWGWGLDDVTCQYIAAAVSGGILVLSSLIYLLISSARSAYSISQARNDPKERWRDWLAWGLVSSIAVHAICFVAVTYFGQAVFLFAFTIGAAFSLGDVLKTMPVGSPRPIRGNSSRAIPGRRRVAST